MNKLITMVLVALYSSVTFAGDSVSTLRGTYAIDDMSPPVEVRKWEHDRKPIERLYIQQPPIIPHKVVGYRINLKSNKCLTCHSWHNYKNSGATKMSLTHFTDRDGAEHSNVAARRYVCTTCHVAQTNAKPLVENTFDPIPLLSH